MKKKIKYIFKNWWLIGSFSIVLLIIWNTSVLFQLIKTEERNKIELWAIAQKELIKSSNLNFNDSNLPFDIIQKIGKTPIIQVNSKGKIIDFKNIDIENMEDKIDSSFLYNRLNLFKSQNQPITINYKNIIDQKIYYGDSTLLQKLKYYPIALSLIIILFALVIFYVYKTSIISEQNMLWAGIAKETAHQIATPITSLIGWVTLIKNKNKKETIDEIEKDIDRLKIISDRFSKIGSIPILKNQNIYLIIFDTINYLKSRSSKSIIWEINSNKKKILAPINAILFSWTIENLLVNSIDSVKGNGIISITIKNTRKYVNVYISDNGSGIKKLEIKNIFKPGYTTKKRGWGLGLSLSKRIIENYHKGKLTLKETKINFGSTFEIELNKSYSKV